MRGSPAEAMEQWQKRAVAIAERNKSAVRSIVCGRTGGAFSVAVRARMARNFVAAATAFKGEVAIERVAGIAARRLEAIHMIDIDARGRHGHFCLRSY